MKIFVTGATGLLGSHAAARLREAGHPVAALCRPGSSTVFLRELGCQIVPGRLEDAPDEHARRMAGCDAVLHAAAHLYGGHSLDAVRAPNVVGTRNVLGGALEAGIPQAVHISSVAVYGDPASPPVTEETPLDAPLRAEDFYGRTKREAEEVAGGFRGRGGMSVTILRPPAVYGERDRLFTPRLVGVLRRPVAFVLGSGDTRLAAVYAGNVVQAIQRALEGHGAGGTFNVTEDVPVTQRTMYAGLARAMGLRPRRIASIPAGVARVVAQVGDTLRIRVPGAEDLSLVRSVRLATQDNPYASDRAREVLGWAPPFTLDQALARTGAWARDTLLPREHP